jgi:SLT domain-containing protein
MISEVFRPNVKDGRSFPYSAATQAGHRNHLHVAVGRLIENLGAVGGPLSFGSGSLMDDEGSVPLWRTLWSGATAVFDSIKNSIVAPLGEFVAKMGDSPIGKIITGIPSKAAEALWSKIKDSVTSMFSDDVPAYTGGPVQDLVKGIAARRGWGEGAEWSALSTLIAKESSWNPNAQNPSSTAYGLFQFLNGTWAGTGFSKSSDPSVQAMAGLRYIADRYGSPSKALAFHRANNWYSEGGPVEAGDGSAPAGAPTLYDTGGWLPPGVTTVLNATNKPEPILTGQQWDELTASRAESTSGVSLIGEYNQTVVSGSPREAMDELVHTLDVVSLGGRYSKGD